jgi:glutathione S-transferase
MAHSTLKIYGVPFSVHTRKVIIAARLKDIPFEVVPVAPVNPATLPPDWQAISPTGLIPVIDDAGFRLFDSTAIVLYLERKVPAPALLPSDTQAYATALSLDAWAGSELFRRVGHPLFHHQIVNPVLRKQPGDQAAIDTALETAAPTAFGYLEARLDGPFLVAGQLTIADVAVVSNLLLFHYLGHRLDGARYPKLARYLRAHLESPQLAAVLRDEKPMVERMGLDPSILS